jgi:chemotaxis protein methyltransferase CheR
MRRLGFADVDRYLAEVMSAAGSEERVALISALTTNVTSFFREPLHHRLFRSQVIPGLIKKLSHGQRVRIWSAGCSEGMEPFSLAMDLVDSVPPELLAGVRLLGTDIHPDVIARARTGTLRSAQLSGLSDEQRARFVTEDSRDGPRLSPELRRMVTFNQLNLLAPWPMRHRFDAIFCRNVVIYFTDAATRSLWPRFADALHPAGWLFIGHSERVAEDDTRLSLVGPTTYRLGALALPSEAP